MGCYTLPGSQARRGDRAGHRPVSDAARRSGGSRPAISRAASSRSSRWRWCCWSSRALLLLDEPSLGLSPSMQGDVFATVQRIAATGVTVLVVEQNVRGALLISDRALVMEQGRQIHGRPGGRGADRSAHPPGLSRRQHPTDRQRRNAWKQARSGQSTSAAPSPTSASNWNGKRTSVKVLTTPRAPEEGVLAGIDADPEAAGRQAGRSRPHHPRHDARHQRHHRAQGRARPR